MKNCPHCKGPLSLEIGQTIYFEGADTEPRLIVSSCYRSGIALVSPRRNRIMQEFESLNELETRVIGFKGSQPSGLAWYTLKPEPRQVGMAPELGMSYSATGQSTRFAFE